MKMFLINRTTGVVDKVIEDTNSEYSATMDNLATYETYTTVIGPDTLVAEQIKIVFDPLTSTYSPQLIIPRTAVTVL